MYAGIGSSGVTSHTVPPAVFASLIGISAATCWAEYAGSNWTTYAAIHTNATARPRQNQ